MVKRACPISGRLRKMRCAQRGVGRNRDAQHKKTCARSIDLNIHRSCRRIASIAGLC